MTVNILRQLPHDPDAYTQGLLFYNDYLYESTGIHGRSSLTQINPDCGSIIKSIPIGSDYFGEGIAVYNDRLFQLTWQEGTCFVYDAKTLKRIRNFSYYGEGWGLTTDGERLFMSDGTFVLKIISPVDFSFIGTKIINYQDGRQVYDLNELEFVDGFIYANIWQRDLIVKIDTTNNKVVANIDISPLRRYVESYYRSEVSNGIAYNPKTKTFFLTGKYWPLTFEVVFVDK